MSNYHRPPAVIMAEMVPPPTNWQKTGMQLTIAGYSFLFIVGICGTTSVMSIIRFIQNSEPLVARSSPNKPTMDTAMYYIFALCLVDFTVLLTIPLTLIDQLLGFWMFGQSFLFNFRAYYL